MMALDATGGEEIRIVSLTTHGFGSALRVIGLTAVCLVMNGLAEARAAEPTAPCPHDVVFVVDGTKSMRKTDPDKRVAASIEALVKASGAEGRVGIVVVGTGARVVHALHTTDAAGVLKLTEVTSKLKFTEKYTNLRDGLDTAWQMLQAKKRPGTIRTIVVLADDDIRLKGSRSGTREAREFLLSTLASQIRKSGVKVVGIALTAKAASMMAQLADQTAGRYFRPLDMSSLPDRIARVRADLCAGVAAPPVEKVDTAAEEEEEDEEEVGDDATEEEEEEEDAEAEPFPWVIVGAAGGGFLFLLIVIIIIIVIVRRRRRPAEDEEYDDYFSNLPPATVQLEAVPEGEEETSIMNVPQAETYACMRHIDRDATWTCPYCHNRFCDECRRYVAGGYCCPSLNCRRRAAQGG